MRGVVDARIDPGLPTAIHWIGDCPAYGWAGHGARTGAFIDARALDMLS